MTKNVTKARALICTLHKLGINDTVACSQAMTMKLFSQSPNKMSNRIDKYNLQHDPKYLSHSKNC